MSVWLFWLLPASWGELPPPCYSEIFCLAKDTHSLLHVVQMANIHKDSKTFVDKSLKTSPREVLQKFDELMKETENNPNKEQVSVFVDNNFDPLPNDDNPQGSEFEDWDPSDWDEDIPLFNLITDPGYRSLAKDLHGRWKDLGRKIKSDVQASPEKYSLHYLHEPFIVPGGRFREMYYWDSYWTIQGLLVSEMPETVKGMLINFVKLIKDIGHIPNGNRIYYNRRSQPPLFISMVQAYFEATHDEKFIEENIEYLDKEFQFWMANRTITVNVGEKKHTLARYNVEVDDPRPESYREDYRDAQKFETIPEQEEFYQNMKSGAESGWDYSTRWFFKEDGSPSEDLVDIETRYIIPVDLNSYLCKNARILSNYYKILDQDQKSQEYAKIFDNFVESIDQVLWNSTSNAWFDYNMKTKLQNPQFYPSNIAPLWAECFAQTKLKEKVLPVLNYITNEEAFQYPGGVPTSMVKSGQQWDLSNAWPPLQEIIVTGLENTGDAKALDIAKKLVEKWLRNVYVSYVQSEKKMFEKYDVEEIGLPGGGGEYDVQEGFGWSNGVLLHFLSKHPDLSNDAFAVRSNGPSMISPSWLCTLVVNTICVVMITTKIIIS